MQISLIQNRQFGAFVQLGDLIARGHLSNPFRMIQGVESSIDFGIVRMKKVLEQLPDALNKLTVERS
jgi:hypothetical protein